MFEEPLPIHLFSHNAHTVSKTEGQRDGQTYR